MDKKSEIAARAERLRTARELVGQRSPFAAAEAFGWNRETYKAHEIGRNGFDNDSGRDYAKAFGVSFSWLMTGEGSPNDRLTVPVVGIAGADPDGAIRFDDEGNLGEAPLPPNGTSRTVAVEVRGDSMRGIAENGWWVFYDNRQDPPTDEFLGRVCVVGLADGRVLVKRLIRGRKKKHFDLESYSAPTIYDARVAWAAPVTAIIPSENVGRLGLRAAV